MYEKPVECPRGDKTSLEVCRAIDNIFPYSEEMIAKEVAFCESGLRLIKSEAKYKDGTPEQSFGIYQIHLKAWPQYSKEKLMSDVEYSVQAGYEVWLKQGWERGWYNCSKRIRLKF